MMAKVQVSNGLVNALVGVCLVYIAIGIARAGYDVGQILAGKATLAQAAANFDITGIGVIAALVLLLGTKPAR